MDTIRICQQCRLPLPENAPEGLCPACLAKVALGSEPAAPGTRIAPEIAQLAPHFPQLEILELLGMGGMGMVYKARQPRLDRIVALKILPVESLQHPSFAERFNREAKALAKLNHPGIVNVYDFGQTGQYYYFVMEYVDGMNLRQLLNNEKVTPRQALALVVQICTALQYAHDEGVVHRDIKPENILINKKGQVKIADFGLAKLLGAAPDTALTMSQAAMGTLNYMAPEQRQNAQGVDHRADIYSLGVVFYEMLTGEVPMGRFEAPSKKVQIDVRLDEVVLRALEREPSRRYQHVSEVKSGVEAVTSAGPEAAPAPPGAKPAPDASAGAVPSFSLMRTYWLFFAGWLAVKFLWNFRLPGFWLACLAMAALLMWASLRRLRLFPEQSAIYSKLAPSTRRGALAMNFFSLVLGFVLLMSALFNFWEQDPLHANSMARSAAQYEAQYKGREFHLLQGLAAFRQNIPNVEMVDVSHWDAGWDRFFVLSPERPGHGYSLAVLYLVLGCFALLLTPCALIGEWRMYQSGMKFRSLSWLFSLSLSWRHARAGLALGACLLGSILPIYFFSEVSAGNVLASRPFLCHTNMDAVTDAIEKWAGQNAYVTSDKLNWNLNTVPDGNRVARARLEEAWKPSPFDRWRSTLISFRRVSPHLAFELVGTENPAQTRLTVSATGNMAQRIPGDLATALEKLESAPSQPPGDHDTHATKDR